MTRAAPPILLAAIGFAALVAAGQPASADSTIRVTVNDDPITSYDITQRTSLMRIAGEKGGEKAAIDQLIDETLEMRDAKAHGIVIPDTRVDGAFAQISGHMKMSPAQLTKALAGEGIAAATLKRRIRVQMAWAQVVQARARFDAGSVKSSDITKALFAEGDPNGITTTEFTLQQIIFVVPKGSSAAYVGQRRREAEGFRLRFAGCDKSIEQAKGLKDVVVRGIPRRTSEDLTDPAGKEVQDTPAGKTAPPTLIDQGVSLIAVCATRKIASNAAAASQIENKLAFEQNKNVGKDYLKKLRDKAVIQYR